MAENGHFKVFVKLGRLLKQIYEYRYERDLCLVLATVWFVKFGGDMVNFNTHRSVE